ncbi:hypothetical protein [Candidatus Mesenet endosymbiont of Agriotes lineatus]
MKIIEAIWYEVVANGDFCRRQLQTSDLKSGVKREFGEHYW